MMDTDLITQRSIVKHLITYLGKISILVAIAVWHPVYASPQADPGDLGLRHDLQLLSDAGLISAPLTTWPLSWSDQSRDLSHLSDDRYLSPEIRAALRRIQWRASKEALHGKLRGHVQIGMIDGPFRLRTFEDTPRDNGEAEVGLQYMGNRFSYRLQITTVDNPADDKEPRLDGSYMNAVFGNWTVSFGATDRWWGPGWEGSLILSSNARPVPGIAIQRNNSDPFETKWLRWLGPWQLVFFLGQLESERAVPDTKLLGIRLNFKPTRNLEIGLSRTAQWCGEGRPCDIDTFIELLKGNDNIGNQGTTVENEPGNQEAGYDLRWASSISGAPYAIYSQLIGEDEAGTFPSHHMGLFGLETWGGWRGTATSFRFHVEYANTVAGFATSKLYNAAYNHIKYKDGYRFYKRSMGHALDGDGKMLSVGLLLSEKDGDVWNMLARRSVLNQDGLGPNPVASHPETIKSIGLSNTFNRGKNVFTWGGEISNSRVDALNSTDTSGAVYFQWRRDI